MRLLRSPLLRALLSALALISWARAVEIRVATFNVELGLEAPGTAGHDAVLEILTRLDADVIGLQELRGADISGSPSNLDALAGSLATNLGWQNHHLHIASTSEVFDTVQLITGLTIAPPRTMRTNPTSTGPRV